MTEKLHMIHFSDQLFFFFNDTMTIDENVNDQFFYKKCLDMKDYL